MNYANNQNGIIVMAASIVDEDGKPITDVDGNRRVRGVCDKDFKFKAGDTISNLPFLNLNGTFKIVRASYCESQGQHNGTKKTFDISIK